ncbi:hypothetical protein [Actinomadura rubrisoli]|uniref:Uncharacterized protein n=1 Tax=Actinomadura rubrisoli TaxID=2530368 RepID=A0A4R5AT72_9ACTN|nr:hypothetical protein [Actinomadura rubrisoli]TDD73672.1 hypothetical protein E1298_33595 [Actinomadura rubrisoli]
MTTTDVQPVGQLIDRWRQAQADHPVRNAFAELAASDALKLEHVRRLVAAELQTHRAELAAYALLLNRFPHRPAVTLFTSFIDLVVQAGPKLHRCADSLGMSLEETTRRFGPPAEQGFNGYVSWLGLHGTQAEVGMALLADMDSYFEGGAALTESADRHGIDLPADVVDYFRPGDASAFYTSTREVLQDALKRGDDPDSALAAARLMEQQLGLLWESIAAR